MYFARENVYIIKIGCYANFYIIYLFIVLFSANDDGAGTIRPGWFSGERHKPDDGLVAWLCDSGGRDGDDRLPGLEGHGSRQRRLLVVEVAHLTAEVVLLALAVPELADAEVVELDPVQSLYVRIAPR